MATYSINQLDLIKQMLPVDKRTDILQSWLDALSDGSSFLNQNLSEYIYGSSYSSYDDGVVYNYGERVDGSLTNINYIYQSITASNFNNPLSDTNYWIQVNNDFIGVNERGLYTANKLTLEYALNRYFKTNFVQPDGVTSSTNSDIYITDNMVINDVYYLGVDFGITYSLYDTITIFDDTSTGWVVDDGYVYPDSLYTIHMPDVTFNNVPGTESGVRQVVNRLNYEPIKYSIVTY